jgi:hypothetical protein
MSDGNSVRVDTDPLDPTVLASLRQLCVKPNVQHSETERTALSVFREWVPALVAELESERVAHEQTRTTLDAILDARSEEAMYAAIDTAGVLREDR